MAKAAAEERLYVGVDVGGTKIQASLVSEAGAVLGRRRCPTPRKGGPAEAMNAIEQTVRELLAEKGLEGDDLSAIGIAVPGVVDAARGLVVVTHNMNLTGAEPAPRLQAAFGTEVVLGNDSDLGTLGETWLGAARGASSAFGIFVGTGIGGGFVCNRKIWRGYRGAASEIGHVVMEIGGPLCGCGNRGCLEAIASRSAVERDIRQAVKDGKKTALTDILGGDLRVIRSGSLKEALARGDKLVRKIVGRAAEVLGYACLTVRHLVDPEVIVLGGGVIEACSDFVFPIVREVVASDRLPGARKGGEVLLSALGDDAVVLGAVALARMHAGRSPFKGRIPAQPVYPRITATAFGQVAVEGKTYPYDIVIRACGKIKKRKKGVARKAYGTSHKVGPKELAKVCRGGPQVLFIGTGQSGKVRLSPEGEQFLRRRAIECHARPTPEVIEAYNASNKRKAALIHVTC